MLELLLHPHFSCDYTTSVSVPACEHADAAGVSAVVTSGCCIRCAGYYCTIVWWPEHCSRLHLTSPHRGDDQDSQNTDIRHRGGPTFGGPSCIFFAHFHPHLSNICFGIEYSAKYWPECPCLSPASDSHHYYQLMPGWFPQLGVSLGQLGLVMQTCHFCVNLHWVSGQLWL